MTAEKILKIGKELESRGANMAKIVAVCRNEEDVLENIKGCIALKEGLKIPFQLQGHGEQAKVLRVINPMPGAMLVFCHQAFKPGGYHDQPLISAMKAVFDRVKWIEVTKPLEEETFL